MTLYELPDTLMGKKLENAYYVLKKGARKGLNYKVQKNIG